MNPVMASPNNQGYRTRIPFGLRFQAWKSMIWLWASLALLVLQMVSGTDPIYACLVFVFAGLSYLAIQAVGGLSTLIGCAIFYLGLQNIFISQVAKVIFWQPGDSRLIWPVQTIGVYDLAMSGILLAGLVYRKLKLVDRKPLLLTELDPQRLKWLAYITTALAIGQMVFSGTQTVNASGGLNVGGIGGMIKSLQFLTPLSVASSTALMILSSQGRRSIGLLNILAIFIPSAFGIFSSGRELIVMTVVIYYLTCMAFGFRFRAIHYVVLFAGIYAAQFILFPYALYGRSYTRTGNFGKNVTRAADLLVDVISNPTKYQQIQAKVHRRDSKFLYFGSSHPTLDRMALITITDGIFDATEREGNTEMDTIAPGFYLSVPRVFFPEKPYFGTGNMLAHREPGLVGKHDFGTGISVCYFADAYSSFGWLGVFAIPFLLTLSMLVVYRLILSLDLRYNVLALSLVVTMAWNYSETPISQNVVGVLQTPVLFALGILIIFRFIDFATHLQRRIEATKQRSLMKKSQWMISNNRIA